MNNIDKNIYISYIKKEDGEIKFTENYTIEHLEESMESSKIESNDSTLSLNNDTQTSKPPYNETFLIQESAINIANSEIGKSCILEGVLETKKLKETTQGNPFYYISLSLNNNYKALSNVWSSLPAFRYLYEIDEKSTVKIRCTIIKQIHASNPTWEIKLEQIQKIEKQNIFDEQNLLIKNAKNEWLALNNSLTDTRLKELALSIITRKEVVSNINNTPATLKSAYSYDGGIIVQLTKTAEIAKMNALKYNINPDIPVFIALIYDLGKTLCISKNKEGNYEKNKSGILLHYSLATTKLLIEQIKYLESTKNINFTEEEKDLFIHLICSIRGNYEKSSLMEPATLEGTILNISYITLCEISKYDSFKDTNSGNIFYHFNKPHIVP